MEIIDIRPTPPGAGRERARVDVQLTPDCRLFNLKIVDGPRGRRLYAPSAFGAGTATFAPALAAEIIRAATAALGENTEYDTRN